MNRISLILLLVVVVVAGVGGYSYWQQQQQAMAGGITEEQDLAREAFLEERGGDAMLRTVGGGIAGEVVSVEGDTVAVKDDAGTETRITLAADGKVMRPTEGQRADVQVGDTVTVLTQTTDEGAVAMMVQLGGGGEMGIGGPIMTAPLVFNGDGPSGGDTSGGTTQMPAITSVTGTVDAVEGNSITITPAEGDAMTIALTDDTRIQVMEMLTLSDLQPGMMVSALGEKQDDGHIEATELMVLPEMALRSMPEQ